MLNAAALGDDTSGTYHWSDAGACSWYDFAVAIQDIALEKGLLKKKIPVKPVTAEDYPAPAKRPAYSVLSKDRAIKELNVETRHWRRQLSAMLDEMVNE